MTLGTDTAPPVLCSDFLLGSAKFAQTLRFLDEVSEAADVHLSLCC